MARRSKSEARTARRREDAAIKLMALGAILLLIPMFLGGTPLGKGLTSLMPIGALLVAGGGAFFWMGRQTSSRATGASTNAAGEFGMAADRLRNQGPPGGTVSEEFARMQDPSLADRRWAQDRPTNWGPGVFSAIEWRRFEAVVEALFQQGGLETRSQSHGADGGVDIWLYSRSQPDQAISIIQCKHWTGKFVGVDKVRELLGVMTAKKVPRGVFATTSRFSADAKEFAQGNRIDLLDVEMLLAMIAKRPADQQKELLDVALEGEYWRPTCANCGIKMVERTSGKDGKKFWGCRNYPRCSSTMSMRMA